MYSSGRTIYFFDRKDQSGSIPVAALTAHGKRRFHHAIAAHLGDGQEAAHATIGDATSP